ncbi:MAG: PEP-CTERM sorting domain-containing protein [Hyphomicrobiales bacterium]|nr:PEP-CTERM sorting domain-containing protein [Hyphomicrobiales bacterium]
MNRSRALRQGLVVFLTAAGTAGGGAQAAVPGNGPPPGYIYDLAALSSASPLVSTVYTFEFTAVSTHTTLTFAFRDDSSFTQFYDPVVSLAQSTANLLHNANFQQTYTGSSGLPLPVGWSYTNYSATTTGGRVIFGGYASGSSFIDGAEQGYDGISQTISTTVGDVYKVSFDAWAAGISKWQQFSTSSFPGSGGNGADVLVYALNGKPIPEISTWAMLGIGFAGLAIVGWRRRAAAGASG